MLNTLLLPAKPMAVFASSTNAVMSRLSRLYENEPNWSFSFSVRSGPGWIQILTPTDVWRRRMSSVANLVHRLSFAGKETPEIASRAELLPEDWSPQTTICGRSTNRLRPWVVLVERVFSNRLGGRKFSYPGTDSEAAINGRVSCVLLQA